MELTGIVFFSKEIVTCLNIDINKTKVAPLMMSTIFETDVVFVGYIF